MPALASRSSPVALRFLTTTLVVFASACGPSVFARVSCAAFEGACREFMPTDAPALLEYTKAVPADSTIVLSAGHFNLDEQLRIRRAGIVLTGQGMDQTRLSFATAPASSGVDIVGDDTVVSYLTVQDTADHGLHVEASDNVLLDHVRATWTEASSAAAGTHGLFALRCTRVLVESCEVSGAVDAGIYVLQTQHAAVRGCVVVSNGAGVKIANTQYAEIQDNLVRGNTSGVWVTDLPQNPMPGRDILIRGNVIARNNKPNTAALDPERAIPAGTGTFVMASRRVVISGNDYEGNRSLDVAILSGLVMRQSASWAIPTDELSGKVGGLELPTDDSGALLNYRTSDVLVVENRFAGSGTDPDGTSAEPGSIGGLLARLYGDGAQPVDAVLYDAFEESSFDATRAHANSNDQVVCVTGNEGASFASLNLPSLGGMSPPDLAAVYRPAAPFAPFDCDAIRGERVRKPSVGGLD